MWIAGIIGLIVGLIIGFIIKMLLPGKSLGHSVQKDYDALKTEFRTYQDHVAQHFSETSSMLEKVNTDLQNVQEHLFSSVQRLNADTHHFQPLLRETENKLKELKENKPTEGFAPKDYA